MFDCDELLTSFCGEWDFYIFPILKSNISWEVYSSCCSLFVFYLFCQNFWHDKWRAWLHEGSLWCHIADCGTLGLKRVGFGPEKGAGWHWMVEERESQIGDLSPLSHTLLPTALHCIASLIRSSPLSLFTKSSPKRGFLTVESPLAFHNWITLVSAPPPLSRLGGRDERAA